MKKQNKDITNEIINKFKPQPDKKILSDVQGSYTGVPVSEPDSTPVQDADDL